MEVLFFKVYHDFLVFLYSVPGHGSKIKQRMLYASCKESVIDNIEKKFGINFDKKVKKVFHRFQSLFFSSVGNLRPNGSDNGLSHATTSSGNSGE